MTKVKVCELVWPRLLVARIVKLFVPAAAGVPEINPLVDRFSPAGKEPPVKEYVFPVVTLAVIV